MLTLGRLPPAVDFARSFHAAGWRVIVAEPFRWHLARTSRTVSKSLVVPAPTQHSEQYLQALLDIVQEEHVSLIVPVSEETMHVVGLEHRLPATCTLFASDATMTRALHSKSNFITVAAAAGLAVPDTAWADSEAGQALLAAHDVFVKPEFSCSGRGVRRIERGGKILADSHLLVQQAIDGKEVSAFAIARDGQILAQVSYEAIVRHGSVAVVFERCDLPEADLWLSRLVEYTQFTGCIAIDAIVDRAGDVYGIECNPRATSGLHFFDNADIAPAIAGSRDTIRLRKERRLQEFWSAWTHFLSVVRDAAARKLTWRAIRSARDVTWHPKDKWVFLLATFSTWPIISQALKQRVTFAEVLALDIEWQDDRET